MSVTPKSKIAAVSGLLVFSVLSSSYAYGQSGKSLSGSQIHALLSDARVKGTDFEQSFGTPKDEIPASTTYWQGKNASYGWWRVTGDTYCSQWQQSGPWSCYDVFSHEQEDEVHIIWVDRTGRRYESVFVPR